MLLKLFIIIILLAIIGSLFSALYFMMKKKDSGDDRVVRALTVRIGLSVTLFIVLISLMFTGVIKPVGIPVEPVANGQPK